MKRCAARDVIRLLLVLQLLLPGSVLITSAAQPQDEELDEVLVTGEKAERDPQKLLGWLARLVGQYSIEGHVNSHAGNRPADQRPVHGQGSCVGFGMGPAVHCELTVEWPREFGPNGEEIPAGVSRLKPAMLLFGFEPERIGIRYLLVDSKGVADGAMGQVSGDTLETKSPCVNIAKGCQQLVRITAESDLLSVGIGIDLLVDARKAASFAFTLKRLPGDTAVVIRTSP